MKKQSLLIFGCIGVFISSCATMALKPGAEKVVVTNIAHTPTGCKEVGQVSAFDTNGTTVTYTSHERMQQYQTHLLQNKTFDLGGNVLVITEHETTYTDADKDTMDTHFLEGNAYACPAEKLKNIQAVAVFNDTQRSEN